MSRKVNSKTRYLVLPDQGIASRIMESSVFKNGHGLSVVQEAAERLGKFELAPSDAEAVPAPIAPIAAFAFADSVGKDDFEVLSQRFSDGPAVVRMTEAAKLALTATNPGLRIVPVTRYHLPGYRSRRNAGPAALPSAVSAQDANGQVFLGDAKRYFLNSLSSGDHQNGQGVTVGVLDTGVDNTHPALQASVALLRCYIPNVETSAGGPVDWGPDNRHNAGHGTHVAGIVAAQAGHGGPAGVAPEARLISYRIFPDSKSGMKGAENGTIIDSIRAAIDDGCHIVNLSLEGPTLKDDGVRTAITDAWNNGVVCIAAAGNGFGNPVSYPAALPPCVAVTAIGRGGMFPDTPDFQRFVSTQRSTIDPAVFLAAFSNFGPRVQFTAPGHAIVSTFPGGEWWFDSGTSMAAPFVAGMLALLLSGNGNILNMAGSPERSAAMLQMLIARAKLLRLPQAAQEGFGLPA